ncbi:PIG-L family deacetylase [Patescibacteria group bacterium AH-259-L07]|nr:PIG-L family deacetylase [Patescibacteria group bacterium AH-259-L07]
MNIIAVGAHLDDIELACGGTLAKAVKGGHRVKMLVMSDSSGVNFKGETIRTKEEALKEGKTASKAIGVRPLEILDFPNKDIPYNSRSVEAIDKVMSEFDPDIVFTHWPFDTHQDHRNTSLATISAARKRENVLLYEPFAPSGRSYIPFRPQVYIDIADTIKDKIRAIKEHKSQYEFYGKDWTEAIQGRARMRGFECNSQYAEVFECLRLKLDTLPLL